MTVSGAARAASTFGIIGFLFIGAAGGCSSGNDGQSSVTPNVEIVDQSTSALGATAVNSINGNYVGCYQRSGAWSVNVSGVGTLTNPVLSVVQDDTSCSLQVTGVVADQLYTGAAPITLGTSYPATATAFAPSGGATAFMANAKISALDFDTNPTITLLYSDDLNSQTASGAAGFYATVTTSTATVSVTAPNYTISLTSGTPFTYQLNAQKVVQSVGGNASLTDGTVTGTAYVIDMGTLLTNLTYAGVAAAYAAGTLHTYTGSNPVIPASNFGLVGQNMSSGITRTIIVSRTVSGVMAYELFKIVFTAP